MRRLKATQMFSHPQPESRERGEGKNGWALRRPPARRVMSAHSGLPCLSLQADMVLEARSSSRGDDEQYGD